MKRQQRKPKTLLDGEDVLGRAAERFVDIAPSMYDTVDNHGRGGTRATGNSFGEENSARKFSSAGGGSKDHVGVQTMGL